MAPNFLDDTAADLYIVMEHGGEDLLSCLLKPAMDAAAKAFVAYQIFRAVLFLHSADIVHRDLKPGNIAVSADYDVKILDFGMARKCTAEDGRMTGYVVTRWYRAPELMLLGGTNYTPAVDIWSVGCILAEMLTVKGDPSCKDTGFGRILFRGADAGRHLECIINVIGKPAPAYVARIKSEGVKWYLQSMVPDSVRKKMADMPYFQGVDPTAVDLLEKIFVYEPEERITAEDALKHPYFAGSHDPTEEPRAHCHFNAAFEDVDADVESWTSACKSEVEGFRANHVGLPSSPAFDATAPPARAAEKYAALRQAERSRPAVSVKFVFQADPAREFAVEFAGDMDFASCKAALLHGANLAVPFDAVSVYFQQARVMCDYTSLAKHGGKNTLTLITQLEPRQRGLERNDTIQQNWWLNALLVLRQHGLTKLKRFIRFEDQDVLERVVKSQWAYTDANALLKSAGWVLNEAQARWELQGSSNSLSASVAAKLTLLRNQEGLPFQYMPSDIFLPNSGAAMVGAVLCDKWEIVKYLQSGSYGHGYKAKDVSTGSEVFIKIFRCNADRSSKSHFEVREAAVRKEIEALLHPWLVSATTTKSATSNTPCFGSVLIPATRVRAQARGEFFFLQTPDLCENGELFDLVTRHRRHFGEGAAKRLFRQLANGMAHMHACGCFHRDLKLENLVLTRSWDLKIMDYGTAKISDSTMHETITQEGRLRRATETKQVGTMIIRPPEMLGLRRCDSWSHDPGAFDVWSCGCILFFLLAIHKLCERDPRCDCTKHKYGQDGCPGYKIFEIIASPTPNPAFPYLANLLDNAADDNDTNGVPKHTKFWQEFACLGLSAGLKDLLNQMLNVEPARRITMAGVLKHPWLQAEDGISDDDFRADMESRL